MQKVDIYLSDVTALPADNTYDVTYLLNDKEHGQNLSPEGSESLYDCIAKHHKIKRYKISV